ncbi:thiamine pyrophosphokinase [Microdochium nivale]|nr:thiamine pyrophosphokinase [Microdochium nivale]
MSTQQTPLGETGFSPSEVVEWHLPRVVRPSDFPGYSYALVILNQPIDNEPLFTELWKNASLRVAADGGANRILQLNKRVLKKQTLSQDASSATTKDSQQPKLYTELDAIVGDLDSLSDEARDFFSPPSHPPSSSTAISASPLSASEQRGRLRHCEIVRDLDQYSTDFTKAVNYVRSGTTSSPSSSSSSSSSPPPPSSAPPPRDVVCLGGLGGRVDQGLSQLHHLYLFQQSPGSYERDGRIFLLSGEGLTFLLQGGAKTHRIHVRNGETAAAAAAMAAMPRPRAFAKHVGILPVREPSVISTRGLEWDVEGWRTEFGGQLSTSNHVVQDVVEVVTSRDVLFTIALRREEGYDEVMEADH